MKTSKFVEDIIEISRKNEARMYESFSKKEEFIEFIKDTTNNKFISDHKNVIEFSSYRGDLYRYEYKIENDKFYLKFKEDIIKLLSPANINEPYNYVKNV